MSKRDKDELYDLVHSLSKAEKRYFKVYFSNHVIGERNKYMRLYDYLAKQTDYSRQKLERRFRGEKFMDHYAKTKGYLVEVILKALRSFHSGKATKDIIYERFQSIRMLDKKGLEDQAEKLLRKLKKYCYETEEFNLLMEVLEFQHWKGYDRSLMRQDVMEERKKVVELIKNHLDYSTLNAKLLAIVVKEDNWVGEARLKMISEVMDNPLMQDPSKALSLTTRFSYYSSHTLYNHLIGNYGKCCYYKSKGVDLYEENPAFLKANYKGYLLAMGNLVTMYYNNADLIGMTESFARMLAAHGKHPGYEQMKFEQKYMFGMLLYKVRKEYDRFDQMVTGFMNELPKFRADLALIKETDIYFNIAVCYFEREMFDVSLDWIIRLINHPRIEDRQYVFIYARAIDLLIHCELDNLDLAAYKSASLYKYLLKSQKPDPFAKAVLQFVKTMTKHRDRFERLEAYRLFRDALLELDEPDYRKIANDQTDYVAWLGGKLGSG